MSVKLLDLDPQRLDGILNAAIKEFALKGFEKASTNIIAKVGGISKALLFHYIKNKQELYQFTCDYFTELLDKEYYMLMDYGIKDLLDRLRQSYLLQIRLLKRYPWIFEFHKLTDADDSEPRQKQDSCCGRIFEQIDETKFRAGLDIEKCKKIILWSNIGFTNQVLEDIQDKKPSSFDDIVIMIKLEEYFGELKKIFYKPDETTLRPV